jgi:hypothetical protein
MATIRLYADGTNPIAIPQKIIKKGEVFFKHRKTNPTELDPHEYLMIRWEDGDNNHMDVLLQLHTPEILFLHEYIETHLLPRISTQEESIEG